MSDAFKKYLEKHRTKFVDLIESQEKALARLYIDAAGAIKEKAELMIEKKGLTYAASKIRINSLLREAAILSNNFEGVLDKALIKSVDLGMEVNKIAMSQYQRSLLDNDIKLGLNKILNKVNPEALKYTYNKIYSDGLKLSKRIWLLDRRTKQEIERIVMQNIIIGGSASDQTTLAALNHLLNPNYNPAKLTALHGRRVSYEASRLLRTEMSIAFNEADRLSSNANPGSTGLKWLMAIGACISCQDLNGLSTEETGYPPLHPNCRCTTLNDVMSVKDFTNSWIDFMHNQDKYPKYQDWILNVYRPVTQGKNWTMM